MQIFFDLADGVFAVVEDAGGEDGIRFASEEDFGHVFEFAGAAAGDDRDVDGFADAACDFEIEAGFRAVGVDAVEDDFAGAQVDGALGPIDSFHAGGFATALGEDFPAIGGDALGIDGDDDALAAEFFGAVGDEFGRGDGGRVDADFVGTGFKHDTHVGHGADAAADGEGHEATIGNALDDIDHGGAAVGAGGDVEKDHFIGTLLIVTNGEFDGITDVTEFAGFGFAELDAAGDLASVDVEAWDDSFGEHCGQNVRRGTEKGNCGWGFLKDIYGSRGQSHYYCVFRFGVFTILRCKLLVVIYLSAVFVSYFIVK